MSGFLAAEINVIVLLFLGDCPRNYDSGEPANQYGREDSRHTNNKCKGVRPPRVVRSQLETVERHSREITHQNTAHLSDTKKEDPCTRARATRRGATTTNDEH